MSASYPSLRETSFCSLVTTQSGTDPIGTAPVYDGFLVMEFALPWKREVTQSDHFPGGVVDALNEAVARGNNIRLQCVVPNPALSIDGHTRLMYFTREDGPFSRFHRIEYVVPNDRIVALTEALLQDNRSLEEFATYRVDNDNVRDLFVCTHGARDACCGKFGFGLYTGLYQFSIDHPEYDVRVWRASHIGGHRFAPTILDLPHGIYWGNIDSESEPFVVTQTGDVEQPRRHYRGSTAFAAPYEQVADGEMFRRIGWEWLAFHKTIRTVAQDEAQEERVIQVDWVDPTTGEQGSAQVTVGVHRVISGPASCGDQPEEWKEYRVRQFAKSA